MLNSGIGHLSATQVQKAEFCQISQAFHASVRNPRPIELQRLEFRQAFHMLQSSIRYVRNVLKAEMNQFCVVIDMFEERVADIRVRCVYDTQPCQSAKHGKICIGKALVISKPDRVDVERSIWNAVWIT
jgi:hypothetical protein